MSHDSLSWALTFFFLDLVINLSLSYSLIHSSPRQRCCFIIFIAWSIYNYLWTQAHNSTFSPVILGLAFISQTSLSVGFLAGSVKGTYRLEVGRQDEWRYSFFSLPVSMLPAAKEGRGSRPPPTSFSSPSTSHQHLLCPCPRALSIMPAHQPWGSFLWTHRSQHTSPSLLFTRFKCGNFSL